MIFFRLLREVKHHWACLVLWWGPGWNPRCCSFATIHSYTFVFTFHAIHYGAGGDYSFLKTILYIFKLIIQYIPVK